MPTKKKPARESPRDLPSIPKDLIDQFVSGPMSAEAIQYASMAFKKALIERALGAELGHHLGYPQGAERPEESSNQRNGKSGKTYAIHKPHLPYGRGMKSGIRVGSMLHLSSYPKQSVGYLSTALQPFSRQPNRFVLVHRIADETMFMQSAHGLEVEPFPSIAVIKTEGYQQGKHGFFNQFIVVFHDRCSARSLNSP